MIQSKQIKQVIERLVLSRPMTLLPALFLLAMPLVDAQPPTKGLTKGASVEGITEYRLDNGLRVLLFPDAASAKITVNITYLVGAKHGNYGETGMAHLLEHLLFKSTAKRASISQELSDRGATYNATTSADRTHFYETLNATDENLRWAIEMEADRMLNSTVAKKDLDSEMTVVRNEMEQGENNPMGALASRTAAASYQWHSYSKSVIGVRSDIENVPIERLQAFYHKYYQPDNAVLVIAGKFDETKTLALTAGAFGAIPRPERKLDKVWTTEPTQDGERMVKVSRLGELQALMAVYHIPAGSHADFEALRVLSFILTDQPSGILYKALVDSKRVANVGGSPQRLAEPGLLVFGCMLDKNQSLEEVRTNLFAILDDAGGNPYDKAAVDRAKANMAKNLDLAMTNTQSIALNLTEWASIGDWRMLFVSRDRLQAVTPEDVQRVARTYLKPANRTVGMFIPSAKPDRVEIPVAPDIAAVVANYKGRDVMAAGEVFDSSPQNVDSRTKRVTLPNGMKLVMLPKKNRGQSVLAQFQIRAGDEKGMGDQQAAMLLASQMFLSGTGNKSRQQIKDEMDRLKCGISPNPLDPNIAMGLTVTATSSSLAGALRLAVESMRDAAFPDQEFENLKRMFVTGMGAAKDQPQALAPMQLAKSLSPYSKGDPRYLPSLEEMIEMLKAVKAEEVRSFHKSYFGATSDSTLTVVGDFEPAEVEALARQLLSEWKAPTGYTRLANPYVKMEAKTANVNTPDKANAMFVAGMNLPISSEDSAYPAMLIANHIFGDPSNGRLFNRLRKKEGWSYGAHSDLSAGDQDNGGSLMIQAIVAPENLVKLEKAVKEELTKMSSEGFTAEEVEKAKAAWLESRKTNRTRDASLLGMLSRNAYLGRTMNWQAEREGKVAALTVQEVNAAIRKYIDPNLLTIVKAGDLKKAAIEP